MNPVRYALLMAIMLVNYVLILLPLRLLAANQDSSAFGFLMGLIHQHGSWILFIGYGGCVILVGSALVRLGQRIFKLLGL